MSLPEKKQRFVHMVSCLVLALCLLLSGCVREQPGGQISETRLLLDTFCTITIHGAVDSGLSVLLDEAFTLCADYEALFSITIEGSDVWRINHAAGEPVEVDIQTIEVINAGIEFGVLSDGMFDITIGRLSRLWDFGEAMISLSNPSDEELDEARQTVDFRQVQVAGNTVRLNNPDAWIDLGAVAKGYIGDKIAGLLLERGASGALINLGGDVIAVGSRQDGSPWRIAVRNPFGDSDEYLGVIEATGVSVISSGIYERQFEKDGIIYHHILNPNTGMPVISDVVSATVITENAMLGEGLSTIAVLAGSEGAREIFRDAHGFIGAVLILEDGEMLMLGDIRLYD